MSLPSNQPAPVATRGATGALLVTAQAFALSGGALFIAMIVLSVVSIVGRKLWSAPIDGDLEILQMGTGVAAAAFFPYCSLMGEHLRVEFFTARASAGSRALMDGVANLLLALAMALLAWRTAIQVGDAHESGEVSLMRNIPVWIPQLCLVPSLALTCLCSVNRAWVHFFAKEGRT